MPSFPQNVIKHKVGLLNLAAELCNVSRACKVMAPPISSAVNFET